MCTESLWPWGDLDAGTLDSAIGCGGSDTLRNQVIGERLACADRGDHQGKDNEASKAEMGFQQPICGAAANVLLAEIYRRRLGVMPIVGIRVKHPRARQGNTALANSDHANSQVNPIVPIKTKKLVNAATKKLCSIRSMELSPKRRPKRLLETRADEMGMIKVWAVLTIHRLEPVGASTSIAPRTPEHNRCEARGTGRPCWPF